MAKMTCTHCGKGLELKDLLRIIHATADIIYGSCAYCGYAQFASTELKKEYWENKKKKPLRQWKCRAKGHFFQGYLLPDVCPKCRKEAEDNNCGTCWLSRFDEIPSIYSNK